MEVQLCGLEKEWGRSKQNVSKENDMKDHKMEEEKLRWQLGQNEKQVEVRRLGLELTVYQIPAENWTSGDRAGWDQKCRPL